MIEYTQEKNIAKKDGFMQELRYSSKPIIYSVDTSFFSVYHGSSAPKRKRAYREKKKSGLR